jgi:hypothetical protein
MQHWTQVRVVRVTLQPSRKKSQREPHLYSADHAVILGLANTLLPYLYWEAKEKRPLPRSDTFSVAHVQKLPWQRVMFTTWYQTGFCGSNLEIQRLTVVWRQTNVSRPDKTERLLSFVLLSLLSQFHLWKYQLHNLEHFKQHEKPRNDHGVQAAILTLRAQWHYSVIQLWACVLFVYLNRLQNLFYKLVWLVHDHGLRKCQI